RGTITFAGAGVVAEPLPKFPPEQLGDCIDCTICVQVCPTGIDIRNGLQYECIACGACIDACDDVMDKMGFEPGLIRYPTQNAIDGAPVRVMRPRIIVYGALLLALCAAWAWGVGARSDLIVEVLRDRNTMYRDTGDGIENTYMLKLVNKSDADRQFTIAVESATDGIVLRDADMTVLAQRDSVVSVPVVVMAPEGIAGRHDIRFVVVAAADGSRTPVDSSFFGPIR